MNEALEQAKEKLIEEIENSNLNTHTISFEKELKRLLEKIIRLI